METTIMERETQGGVIRLEVHIKHSQIPHSELEEAIAIMRQIADALSLELEAMKMGAPSTVLGLSKN